MGKTRRYEINPVSGWPRTKHVDLDTGETTVVVHRPEIAGGEYVLALGGPQ